MIGVPWPPPRARARRCHFSRLRLVTILQPRSGTMTAEMRVNRERAVGFGVALLALLGGCGAGTLGVTGTGGSAGTGGGAGTGGVMTGSGGGVVVDPGAVLLAEGLPGGPWDIAVDGTHVYWTDQKAWALRKVPKAGGEVTTLATAQEGIFRLAVDSNFVYWINSVTIGSVMKVPIGGGDPIPIASARWPRGIAVDATNVYWTSAETDGGGRGAVMKASHATGEVVTLAENQSSASAIAVDATNVYWTNADTVGNGQGAVMTVPITGGMPVKLFQSQPADAGTYAQLIPTVLAVDGTNVYWIHATQPLPGAPSVDNALQAMPRARGPVTTLSQETTMTIQARSIVVDGSILTWTGEIAVMRMPAAGGAVTTLQVPGQPALVAVDPTHIYFTLRNGMVMAMAKP
jgi:hypothetical protein